MPETQLGQINEDIMETARGALLVLDSAFRVLKANHSFCDTFALTREQTVGCLIFDLDNRQWDIPKLKVLLFDLLHPDKRLDNYEVEHIFSTTGQRTMVFNACRLPVQESGSHMTILAIEDVTDRRRMEEEIREIYFRDRLTGLYNRFGFTTFAEQQFKAVRRTKKQMMLAFLDIDGMKLINDNLGHDGGDKILMDAAAVLRQTFRESDIIARMGGDAFAVLSSDTTDMAPQVIGERLKYCLDVYNAEENRRCKLSFSVGMAIYHADNPSTLDELMAQAEMLMHAKKRMKNR